MTHEFTGFLIKEFEIVGDVDLAESYTLRRFEDPFRGSGLRLNDRLGHAMNLDTVLSLAAQLPIPHGVAWCFLSFNCWGGIVDRLWGYVHGPDLSYGPLEDGTRTATESLQELLQAFGVHDRNSTGILPLTRGFWGEGSLLAC